MFRGSLLDSQEWKRRIVSFREQVGLMGSFSDKKEALRELKKDLLCSVQKRIPGERFGVFFSGGIDSSFISFLCRGLGRDFSCFTASVGCSKDLVASRDAARLMGLDLREAVCSLVEAEEIFMAVKEIIPECDVVNVGVGAVVYAASLAAQEEGVKCVFSGLGSEEIFAGYQRHSNAPDINQECWRGLEQLMVRDLLRDFSIARFFGMTFLTPFLDDALLVSSMRVPGCWKISDLGNKAVLREAAIELGLPEVISLRRKIAAQYGSAFDSAMEKLSRKRGFRSKKMYVDSL